MKKFKTSLLLCAAALAMGGLAGCDKKNKDQTPETPVDTTVHVESVSLDKTELKLTPGGTASLNATVLPENATNKAVSFTSSVPATATVDSNGVVNAVAVGDTVITATTTDGNKTATCNVAVRNIFTGLSLEDATKPFNRAAQTIALTGELPEGATFSYVEGFEGGILPGNYVVKGVVKGEGYFDLELAANLTISSEKEFTPFVVNNFETYANDNELSDDVTFLYWDYNSTEDDKWVEPGAKGSVHIADNNLLIGTGSKTLKMELTYQNSAFKVEKELGQTFNKTFEAIELDTLVDSRTAVGNVIIEAQLFFKNVPLPEAYAGYKDAVYLDYRFSNDAPSNWTHWVMPLSEPYSVCGGAFTLEQLEGLGLTPEILTLYLDKVALVAKPFNGNYGQVDVYFDNVQLRHAGEKSSRQFVENLGGKVYTIESNDGTIFKFTNNGDTSRLESLNLKNNVALDGNATQVDEKITFVGSPDGGAHNVTYTFRARTQGMRMSVDQEVTGDVAILEGVADHLDFTGKEGAAVYLIDNFNDYEGTGVGYDRGHKDLEALEGLRANYYGEVYNADKPAPGLIGDQNWNLMNDSGWTTYISLADSGHEGKAMHIVGKNSWATRYINMQLLNPNGAPLLGRGAYLSFFVKGSAKFSMTARVHYSNKINATLAASTSGTVAFGDVPVTTSWTRITLPISQFRNVYGIQFNPDKTADVDLYIDDIMLHGEADPYAVYTPPTINAGTYAYNDGTNTYAIQVASGVTGAALAKNNSLVTNLTAEMGDGVVTFKDVTNAGDGLTLTAKISNDDFTIETVTGTMAEDHAALAGKHFAKIAALNYDLAGETSEKDLTDTRWSWSKYDNGLWRKVQSTQMRVRRNTAQTNYFVNMACGNSVPWAYKFQDTHKIGYANHFEVEYGNNFTGCTDIDVKVRLILTNGSFNYVVGTADEWVKVLANTGARLTDEWEKWSVDFAPCDVKAVEFVIKSAKSGTDYFFIDNLKVNYQVA